MTRQAFLVRIAMTSADQVLEFRLNLNNFCQHLGLGHPSYQEDEPQGPEHNPSWTSTVSSRSPNCLSYVILPSGKSEEFHMETETEETEMVPGKWQLKGLCSNYTRYTRAILSCIPQHKFSFRRLISSVLS